MALTNTALLMGGQLTSTAAGVTGDLTQASALRGQGRAAMAVAERNARYLNLRARDAKERGQREASTLGREGAALEGRQLAVQGAQGIDPSVGSAAAVRGATQRMTQEDVLTIERNAMLEAWGFEQEARETISAGRVERNAYRNAARATASTAGYRVARDLLQAGQLYARDPYFFESQRPGAGAGEIAGAITGTGVGSGAGSRVGAVTAGARAGARARARK
jgi:hypothetical protein